MKYNADDYQGFRVTNTTPKKSYKNTWKAVGSYEVVVSDSARHWSLSITSKGNGKGAAVCAKMN